MQGFKALANNNNNTSHMNHHSFLFHSSRFGDIGELDQFPIAFHQNDAIDFTRSSVYGPVKSFNASNTSSLHFDHNLLLTGEVSSEKSPAPALPTVAASVDNWRDPVMEENTHQTDTSVDAHTHDRNQCGEVQHVATTVLNKPTQQSKRKFEDVNVTYQTRKRLAQNREAARKSRIRKKAYVQELETSRLKLAQLEQELEKVRQQGVLVATGIVGDHGRSNGGALSFDMEYARWLEEHQTLINELRSAISTHLCDEDLRILVDGVMLHYIEFFRLKGMGSKSDIFHMLSGMWITPAERFFMWLGGFRSSELLKILVSYLEPLTDQQLMGFCNLQQSSQQAEDALSQGMEALQQSLVETLSSTSPGPEGSGIVDEYMGRMAVAMTKLTTLENFAHQADLLRQQTLQQLQRILTTRQAARALLVIHDYTSRLRALSSLWLARPKN